jgi:hypothetical protein
MPDLQKFATNMLFEPTMKYLQYP